MDIATKITASPPSPSPRPISTDKQGEAGRVATASVRAAPYTRMFAGARAKLPPAHGIGAQPAFPSATNHSLELLVDKGTGEVFARVINNDTGRVIDEMPAKALRHLATQIKELLGRLLDRTA